jgi:hypothetical protein
MPYECKTAASAFLSPRFRLRNMSWLKALNESLCKEPLKNPADVGKISGGLSDAFKSSRNCMVYRYSLTALMPEEGPFFLMVTFKESLPEYTGIILQLASIDLTGILSAKHAPEAELIKRIK